MSKPQQASLNHTLVGGSEDAEHDAPHALLQLALALVDSALDILGRDITSDEQLRRESVLMPGGTLGKHFRHVIETFNAFLLPLLDTARPGPIIVNYDAILPTSRRPVARSLQCCKQAMSNIRQGLERWGQSNDLTAQFERNVELVAITPTRQELTSSVGRELWFCSLHAIHHFSMLRTIAVHELGIKLPVEFGTAPSTLLYRGKSWKPSTEIKAKL